MVPARMMRYALFMTTDQYLHDIRDVSDPITWAFITGAHLLGAGRASLLLRSPDEPVLSAVATLGVELTTAPTIRVPIGEGIAGLVAERGVRFVGSRNGVVFMSLPIITDRGVE